MKEVIDNAIIIIFIITRVVNIILDSPPNVRIIKTLISRKRTKAENIVTMIGIVLVLLSVIVNTPNVVYTMALNIATINIAIININPAIAAAIAPRIASAKFSAVYSNEKSKKINKASGSRNIKAKIVIVLISSNTPMTILNVLIKFIISFHFHFGFQEINFVI